MTRIARGGFVAGLIIAGNAVLAGDYGLTIDDSLGVECASSLELSRNTCRSDAVLADLRARHVEAKAYRIVAVRVSLPHCRVSLRGADERSSFYSGLAGLVGRQGVADDKALLQAVACFPFDGMRTALDNELARGGQPTDVRKRLTEARAMLSRE